MGKEVLKSWVAMLLGMNGYGTLERFEITEKWELQVMICGASLYSDSLRQFRVRTKW